MSHLRLSRYSFNAEAQQQWTEAEEQIRQYAEGPKVKQLVGQTQLHLLILQIRGYELERLGIVEKQTPKG